MHVLSAYSTMCLIVGCIHFFHTSSADSSPYSTPSQPITKRADEWTNQKETWHHSPERHLGRYCVSTVDSVSLRFVLRLTYLLNTVFLVLFINCFSYA